MAAKFEEIRGDVSGDIVIDPSQVLHLQSLAIQVLQERLNGLHRAVVVRYGF